MNKIINKTEVSTIVIVCSYYAQTQERSKDFKGRIVYFKLTVPNDIYNKSYWKILVTPTIRKIKSIKNFKNLKYEGFLMENWFMHWYSVFPRGYSNWMPYFGEFLFCEEDEYSRIEFEEYIIKYEIRIGGKVTYNDALTKCIPIEDIKDL